MKEEEKKVKENKQDESAKNAQNPDFLWTLPKEEEDKNEIHDN